MTNRPIMSTFRTMTFATILLLALWSDPLLAQTDTKRLVGFAKVTTLISYTPTGKAPLAVSEDRIRTILELKLRSNGLRVLTTQEDDKDPDLNPYVFLEVNTLEAKNQSGSSIGFAYSARLSVRLFARIPINDARAPVEMWVADTMGVSSNENASATVERVVTALAEELLNAWLTANPRR